MNGYDANALEAALKLKEQHGGRVTAVEQPLRESRTIQHKRLPAYRRRWQQEGT
jgi:electron transfer flavoprotein alpha/beta subunit